MNWLAILELTGAVFVALGYFEFGRSAVRGARVTIFACAVMLVWAFFKDAYSIMVLNVFLAGVNYNTIRRSRR